MKRIIIIFQLLLLFSVAASGTIESWSTLGGEYTHLAGQQENAQFDGLIQDEYGIYLGYAGFTGSSHIGFYSRGIIQIPFRGELKFQEAFSSPEPQQYGFGTSETILLGRMMVGPIYRINMGPQNDLYFAIGPELRSYEIITTHSLGKEYAYIFYLGVGLDLGYKYNLNNFSFVHFGINADYAANGHIGTNLILSTYIGFGFRY